MWLLARIVGRYYLKISFVPLLTNPQYTTRYSFCFSLFILVTTDLFERFESKFGLGPRDRSLHVLTFKSLTRLVSSEANVDTENREISVPTDSRDGDRSIFIFGSAWLRCISKPREKMEAEDDKGSVCDWTSSFLQSSSTLLVLKLMDTEEVSFPPVVSFLNILKEAWQKLMGKRLTPSQFPVYFMRNYRFTLTWTRNKIRGKQFYRIDCKRLSK